ncbi:hypothetical protein PMAYCL1PPCAC_08822, partial [Pristionchus mayeri]
SEVFFSHGQASTAHDWFGPKKKEFVPGASAGIPKMEEEPETPPNDRALVFVAPQMHPYSILLNPFLLAL